MNRVVRKRACYESQLLLNWKSAIDIKAKEIQTVDSDLQLTLILKTLWRIIKTIHKQ